jgi:acetyl esterase/lipase
MSITSFDVNEGLTPIFTPKRPGPKLVDAGRSPRITLYRLADLPPLAAPGRPVPAPGPGVAAVVALNPVVDLLAYPPGQQRALEQDAGIAAGRAIDYSPAELVRPGNPPVLIQHGTHDEVAPISQARRFRDAIAQAGNDCVLREYAGAGHGFHYPGPAGYFDQVTEATAGFLLSRLAAG